MHGRINDLLAYKLYRKGRQGGGGFYEKKRFKEVV